jgi:transcriptional regulator with XRE-family HTH domain
LSEKEKQNKYKPCSPELLTILGDNVKQIKHERVMSQKDLSDIAKMHRTFISLIERRERNATLGVIEALTKALDVDVPTLLTIIYRKFNLLD